jgi:hypothetical protein
MKPITEDKIETFSNEVLLSMGLKLYFDINYQFNKKTKWK